MKHLAKLGVTRETTGRNYGCIQLTTNISSFSTRELSATLNNPTNRKAITRPIAPVKAGGKWKTLHPETHVWFLRANRGFSTIL
jgi:hypothetical protein